MGQEDPKTDPPDPKGGGDDKTFSQADVDRIVADRLSREKGKYSDYDELKAKAEQLDELEAQNKSDLDKANDTASSEKARADKAEAELLRYQIASEKGLTAPQAKRLTGATREELEADADEILEHFPAAGGEGPKPPPSPRPASELKGGTDPTSVPEENDPAKLAGSVPRY